MNIYDQSGTERLAAALAAELRPGDAILLHGPLGAGKTTFARALIRAVAADPALEVPSPSYTLVQTYETPRLILHHFDLWRLDGPGALPELGWDEARADIVLVEWPDRLGDLRPEHSIDIHITPIDHDHRQIDIAGRLDHPSPAKSPLPREQRVG